MTSTRFRGRIPVSLADITGSAGMLRAELDHKPDREDAERLAREHNNRAAEAGWVPDWDELTPMQRDRATLDALPYLRAMRELQLDGAAPAEVIP